MNGGKTKTERFRERAKQIRHIAVDVRSAEDCKTLEAIAKEFEQMATQAGRKGARAKR